MCSTEQLLALAAFEAVGFVWIAPKAWAWNFRAGKYDALMADAAKRVGRRLLGDAFVDGLKRAVEAARARAAAFSACDVDGEGWCDAHDQAWTACRGVA